VRITKYIFLAAIIYAASSFLISAKADLPVPGAEKTAYFDGVDEIVVHLQNGSSSPRFAGVFSGLDPTAGEPPYASLESATITLLQEKLGPALVVPVVGYSRLLTKPPSGPLSLDMKESQLVVRITISYSPSGDKDGEFVATITPSIWRRPPQGAIHDRTSGFNQNFMRMQTSLPFIYRLNELPSGKQRMIVMRQSIEDVANFLKRNAPDLFILE